MGLVLGATDVGTLRSVRRQVQLLRFGCVCLRLAIDSGCVASGSVNLGAVSRCGGARGAGGGVYR